jgi:hypothetical protein
MNTLEKFGVGSAIAGFLGLLVFAPVITFGFAYLGGLILEWTVGNSVSSGLNIVFNTTRFTPELIPIACATFATIGKYFKSNQTNNNKTK